MGRNLRYAPDSQYVMIAYACVFLLKLLQPAFASFSDEGLLLDVVSHMANLLQSLAVSSTHTPYQYSLFLHALVRAQHDHCTKEARSATTTAPARSWAAASPLMTTHDPTTGRNTDSKAESSAAAVAAAQTVSRPSCTPPPPPPQPQPQPQPPHPASRETSRIGTPTMMGPATAAQFMPGFPLMPGGPDDLLAESFWSSFLPPGFGSGSQLEAGTNSFGLAGPGRRD